MFSEGETPDAYIISYGPEVDRLVQKLKINSVNIAVVNARFFKPLDEEMIREIAAANKPVFTYEIDMLKGGLSSSILEYCNDNGLNMPMKRFGIHEQYVTHGSVNALKKSLGLDINTFCNEVLKEVYHQ